MRRAAAILIPLCLLVAAGCGDTVQSKPVSANTLEGLVASPFPVYWAGARFSGMGVSEAVRDPSGSWAVGYGPCVKGGQGTCTPALRIVTSPDNSFLPGGATPSETFRLRGVSVRSAQEGRTLILGTGGVVVVVYATRSSLADDAARTMVPINDLLAPGQTLPAPLPDTGFGEQPLPSQEPSAQKAIG